MPRYRAMRHCVLVKQRLSDVQDTGRCPFNEPINVNRVLRNRKKRDVTAMCAQYDPIGRRARWSYGEDVLKINHSESTVVPGGCAPVAAMPQTASDCAVPAQSRRDDIPAGRVGVASIRFLFSPLRYA